jgi:hypothetical protein
MNLTEQVEAAKRLRALWDFLFADLKFPPPTPRQFLVWLELYGEKSAEQGFSRANAWVNKVTRERRITLDALIRYASACARNYKDEAEGKTVRSGS